MDHNDCDITVTQVWTDDGKCKESVVHCDTHGVDL